MSADFFTPDDGDVAVDFQSDEPQFAPQVPDFSPEVSFTPTTQFQLPSKVQGGVDHYNTLAMAGRVPDAIPASDANIYARGAQIFDSLLQGANGNLTPETLLRNPHWDRLAEAGMTPQALQAIQASTFRAIQPHLKAYQQQQAFKANFANIQRDPLAAGFVEPFMPFVQQGGARALTAMTVAAQKANILRSDRDLARNFQAMSNSQNQGDQDALTDAMHADSASRFNHVISKWAENKEKRENTRLLLHSDLDDAFAGLESNPTAVAIHQMMEGVVAQGRYDRPNGSSLLRRDLKALFQSPADGKAGFLFLPDMERRIEGQIKERQKQGIFEHELFVTPEFQVISKEGPDGSDRYQKYVDHAKRAAFGQYDISKKGVGDWIEMPTGTFQGGTGGALFPIFPRAMIRAMQDLRDPRTGQTISSLNIQGMASFQDGEHTYVYRPWLEKAGVTLEDLYDPEGKQWKPYKLKPGQEQWFAPATNQFKTPLVSASEFMSAKPGERLTPDRPSTRQLLMAAQDALRRAPSEFEAPTPAPTMMGEVKKAVLRPVAEHLERWALTIPAIASEGFNTVRGIVQELTGDAPGAVDSYRKALGHDALSYANLDEQIREANAGDFMGLKALAADPNATTPQVIASTVLGSLSGLAMFLADIGISGGGAISKLATGQVAETAAATFTGKKAAITDTVTKLNSFARGWMPGTKNLERLKATGMAGPEIERAWKVRNAALGVLHDIILFPTMAALHGEDDAKQLLKQGLAGAVFGGVSRLAGPGFALPGLGGKARLTVFAPKQPAGWVEGATEMGGGLRGGSYYLLPSMGRTVAAVAGEGVLFGADSMMQAMEGKTPSEILAQWKDPAFVSDRLMEMFYMMMGRHDVKALGRRPTEAPGEPPALEMEVVRSQLPHRGPAGLLTGGGGPIITPYPGPTVDAVARRVTIPSYPPSDYPPVVTQYPAPGRQPLALLEPPKPRPQQEFLGVHGTGDRQQAIEEAVRLGTLPPPAEGELPQNATPSQIEKYYARLEKTRNMGAGTLEKLVLDSFAATRRERMRQTAIDAVIAARKAGRQVDWRVKTNAQIAIEEEAERKRLAVIATEAELVAEMERVEAEAAKNPEQREASEDLIALYRSVFPDVDARNQTTGRVPSPEEQAKRDVEIARVKAARAVAVPILKAIHEAESPKNSWDVLTSKDADVRRAIKNHTQVIGERVVLNEAGLRLVDPERFESDLPGLTAELQGKIEAAKQIHTELESGKAKEREKAQREFDVMRVNPEKEVKAWTDALKDAAARGDTKGIKRAQAALRKAEATLAHARGVFKKEMARIERGNEPVKRRKKPGGSILEFAETGPVLGAFIGLEVGKIKHPSSKGKEITKHEKRFGLAPGPAWEKKESGGEYDGAPEMGKGENQLPPDLYWKIFEKPGKGGTSPDDAAKELAYSLGWISEGAPDPMDLVERMWASIASEAKSAAREKKYVEAEAKSVEAAEKEQLAKEAAKKEAAADATLAKVAGAARVQEGEPEMGSAAYIKEYKALIERAKQIATKAIPRNEIEQKFTKVLDYVERQLKKNKIRVWWPDEPDWEQHGDVVFPKFSDYETGEPLKKTTPQQDLLMQDYEGLHKLSIDADAFAKEFVHDFIESLEEGRGPFSVGHLRDLVELGEGIVSGKPIPIKLRASAPSKSIPKPPSPQMEFGSIPSKSRLGPFRKKTGEAGFIIHPAEVVKVIEAAATKALAFIQRVGDDFARWSREMVTRFGEGVREFLQRAWEQAKGLAKRFQSESGAFRPFAGAEERPSRPVPTEQEFNARAREVEQTFADLKLTPGDEKIMVALSVHFRREMQDVIRKYQEKGIPLDEVALQGGGNDLHEMAKAWKQYSKTLPVDQLVTEYDRLMKQEQAERSKIEGEARPSTRQAAAEWLLGRDEFAPMRAWIRKRIENARKAWSAKEMRALGGAYTRNAGQSTSAEDLAKGKFWAEVFPGRGEREMAPHKSMFKVYGEDLRLAKMAAKDEAIRLNVENKRIRRDISLQEEIETAEQLQAEATGADRPSRARDVPLAPDEFAAAEAHARELLTSPDHPIPTDTFLAFTKAIEGEPKILHSEAQEMQKMLKPIIQAIMETRDATPKEALFIVSRAMKALGEEHISRLAARVVPDSVTSLESFRKALVPEGTPSEAFRDIVENADRQVAESKLREKDTKDAEAMKENIRQQKSAACDLRVDPRFTQGTLL